MHNFKCKNIAGCETALSQQIIELDEGAEQLCPECRLQLVSCEKKRSRNKEHKSGSTWMVWVSVCVAALIVMTLSSIYLLRSGWIRTHHPGAQNTAQVTAPVSTSVLPCGLQPAQSVDVSRLLQYLKQGMNYAAEKKPDLALTEFQQVLKIDPNFLGAQMNLGAVYMTQNKLPQAEASFTSELKLIACLKQMNDASLSGFAYMDEVTSQSAQQKQQMQAMAFRGHLDKAEADAHFNLACVNSRRSLKGSALAELEKAMAGGLIDRRLIQAEPELKAIRTTHEFKTLMARYNPPPSGNL